MEEQARVERLKTLGKGKDTVFKISYQDKVTLLKSWMVKVCQGCCDSPNWVSLAGALLLSHSQNRVFSFYYPKTILL